MNPSNSFKHDKVKGYKQFCIIVKGLLILISDYRKDSEDMLKHYARL